MAALLEQPRVGGCRSSSSPASRALRDALQVAQRHGAHVEQVAVARIQAEQAIGGCQRFAEAMLFDQLLQFAQFCIDTAGSTAVAGVAMDCIIK